MLDTLDTVDWESLGAANIPQLLRDLTSDEQERTLEADRRLQARLEYPATYYASKEDLFRAELALVPFFFELLQNETLTRKDLILDLLNLLDIVVTEDNYEEPAQSRSHQIHSLIKDRWALYIFLLDEGNRSTQQSAVYLLERFPEHWESLITALFRQLAHETDQAFRVFIVWTLGDLLFQRPSLPPDAQQSYENLLAEAMRLPPGSPSRAAAAIQLVYRNGKDAPETAIREVLRLVREESDFHFSIDGIPFLWDHLWKGIKKLPSDRIIAEFTAMLPQMPARRDHCFIAAFVILLDRVFGHAKFDDYEIGPVYTLDGILDFVLFTPLNAKMSPSEQHIDLHSLTESQRRVLQMWVDDDRLWGLHGNLYDVYGLPKSRDELRGLLGR